MRSRTVLTFAGLVFSILAVTMFARASDIVRVPCPHCQAQDGPGCKEWVEHRCRMVEVKVPIKKTVYECKEVPYCKHQPPGLGHHGCCRECEACPRYKKVLIKREIVCGEKCQVKCIVEEIVHKSTCCEHCQAPAPVVPPTP